MNICEPLCDSPTAAELVGGYNSLSSIWETLWFIEVSEWWTSISNRLKAGLTTYF